MKRRFLLVLTIFAILNTLYSVHAQKEAEERILGMSISTLMVTIPLAMMVLGLLFFVGLYVKDHYKSIISTFKNKLKRRKVREVGKKVTDYPKELQDMQKRLPILEPEEALQNLSNLAKKFFAEKINIEHEFTSRGLEKELEKVNPSWASFPQRLSQLRYSSEPLSKKEVTELMKEFWNIIKYEKRKKVSLTVVEKLKKRRLILEIGLLKNLRHYLERAKPEKEEKLTSKDVTKYFVKRQGQRVRTLTDLLRKLKTDAVNKVKSQLETVNKIVGFVSHKLAERKIDNMLGLLESIQNNLKQGKILQAKIAYKQAYQLYYRLPIEEQVHIVTGLQNLQQKLRDYIPPQIKIKKTVIEQIKDRIKGFIQQKQTAQTTNKTNSLIKESQKQISQGKIGQAKNTYKQAYQLYYKLPIEEQILALYQLRKIKDEITELEKEKERQEIEELSKELNKLKSEEDIYVILDKGDIYKKLSHLANYIQKVGEQEIHGIKAGKDHLKEKLKDLVKTTEKVEHEKGKKLTCREKGILTKVKEFGTFFAKKEETVEKAFKQTQKHVFDQIHGLTKQVKTKPKILPELKPQKPPMPPIKKITSKELLKIEKILLFLKNKKEQGLYKIKPAGKEFLERIEAIANSIKEGEQKGATELQGHEKEFLNSITIFMEKDKEKILSPIEHERRMLEFLEHMREKKMIQLDEQKLQKEKERLTKPLELPQVKLGIGRLKKLKEEEEKVMKAIQKPPRILPPPVRVHEREPLKRYEWEITAEEIRKKKTKASLDLSKEEKDIQAKLRELEEI